MKYLIKKEEHPVYLQLYRQIREDIVRGNYKTGDKLPSKRLLAEEVGVSTITVEHAYELLCDEGYAEARKEADFSSFSVRATALLLPKKASDRFCQSKKECLKSRLSPSPCSAKQCAVFFRTTMTGYSKNPRIPGLLSCGAR